MLSMACSQGVVTSPLRLLWLSFEQKLWILPALGFIIQKGQNLTFDLTVIRDLKSILKSGVCFGETPWRAFERLLAGLDRPLVLDIAGGGGIRPIHQTVVGTEKAQAVPG